MYRHRRGMIGMIALIFIFGCTVSTKVQEHTLAGDAPQDYNIEDWIEGHLIPRLIEVVKKNPNLKNKSFTIAGWDVDQQRIKTEIDDLTKEVREMISGGLLKEGGVQYCPLFSPEPLSTSHHDRLVDVPCESSNSVDMYLLITTRISALSGKLILRTQLAFPESIKGFTFFSGFSETYEGVASPEIRALLNRAGTDEYLRGLRYLPFDVGQQDLLAGYLAHRISCIFKDMSASEELNVFLDRSNIQAGTDLEETFTMIELYLDKFHEIDIRTNRSDANVIMSCLAIDMGDDLYQVWLTPERKDGRKLGASTEAYIKKK